MRALVVDDSKVIRRLLRGMLAQHCNFDECIEAPDGIEAVKHARKGGFDLILLDWDLPGMSGIDVLKQVRGWGNTTPIIMVTGESGKARVVEAYDAGVNNYIVKPFEPSVLAEKILKIFNGFLDQTKKSSPRRALIVDDSSIARRLLFGVLQHNCEFEEVVQVSDGVEAVEAVKRQDFDVILLDWNMPNMRGIDALKKIRWMGNTTPVIMVTSETEKDRIVEALESGANDYIVKPFTPKTVERRVKRLLGMHH